MDFGTFEEELAMKSYIVSLLVKQASADGDIAPEETSYLVFASEALGLEKTDIKPIIKTPESYSISPPPDEDKRLTILYYLLFMMRADHTVDSKEEELCYKVGFQMGFRQDMIGDLIGVMKQYLIEKMPPLAMLDKIKPFLN